MGRVGKKPNADNQKIIKHEKILCDLLIARSSFKSFFKFCLIDLNSVFKAGVFKALIK